MRESAYPSLSLFLSLSLTPLPRVSICTGTALPRILGCVVGGHGCPWPWGYRPSCDWDARRRRRRATTSSNRHQENAGRAAPVVRDAFADLSLCPRPPTSLRCLHRHRIPFLTAAPPASNLFLLNWPHFALLSADSGKALGFSFP